MIELLSLLSKFESVKNVENDVAYFMTNVPWIAPEAYLNVVFKPAPADVLLGVKTEMDIPAPFSDFLEQHNGAILLSNSLSLYGVVRKGQVLDRSNRYALPPYNIASENRSWPPPDTDRFLKIGAYGFDGSSVCIDRTDLKIVVFQRRAKNPFCSWPSFEEWLKTEVERLVRLFDKSGKRLVEGVETLPAGGIVN